VQFTDQLGHTISLPTAPQRILSLVPSQTELLFDLGLDEEVVGLTRFCVHPAEKCRTKKIVGGTKQFNFEAIVSLQPDLVLGNKEENYREGIEQLRQSYPVWLSDIITLEDACAMINSVGAMVRRKEAAAQIVSRIYEAFSSLPQGPRLRAAYLIWRKPYMVAGNRTFAHTMLQKAGFVNVFAHLPRYPEVTPAQIMAAKPDLLLLPSEPFPFSEKHRDEFRAHMPQTPTLLVDGQMFTWYGSRLLRAAAYFRGLRHQLAALGAV
jgi:ABC-type Fe3+-hydroxamate transport system substrate-binding protein